MPVTSQPKPFFRFSRIVRDRQQEHQFNAVFDVDGEGWKFRTLVDWVRDQVNGTASSSFRRRGTVSNPVKIYPHLRSGDRLDIACVDLERVQHKIEDVLAHRRNWGIDQYMVDPLCHLVEAIDTAKADRDAILSGKKQAPKTAAELEEEHGDTRFFRDKLREQQGEERSRDRFNRYSGWGWSFLEPKPKPETPRGLALGRAEREGDKTRFWGEFAERADKKGRMVLCAIFSKNHEEVAIAVTKLEQRRDTMKNNGVMPDQTDEAIRLAKKKGYVPK